MSAYNPHIHHRRSIRLKGFDYSREGLYFVTICVQNRACLFGDVENDVMILNDMGRMVEKWYYELQNKFQDMKCREMVVMPNHFHCIVENVGTSVGATVGADLRVCPDDTRVCPDDLQGEHLGSPLRVCPDDLQGEHIGSPLRGMVQWFKTMTTNEYIRGVKTLGWQPFTGKLWQRNYHEHIIRHEQKYQTISEYIINNPAKWAVDKFYIQ
jgi:REP element-mobilizing transposase RayT